MIILTFIVGILIVGLTCYILYRNDIFDFTINNSNSIGDQKNNEGTINYTQSINSDSSDIDYSDTNGNRIKIKGSGNKINVGAGKNNISIKQSNNKGNIVNSIRGDNIEITQTSVNGRKRNKIVVDGVTIIDQINDKKE